MSLTPATATITTGQTISLKAPFSGVPLTWLVNGVTGGDSSDGTIDENGNYTAPSLPTTGAVTISAQFVLGSKSNPVTPQSTVSIVNPEPQVAQISPAAISRGSAQITLTGTGFNPGSSVTVNGQPVLTTYIDPSHVVAQVPQSATDSSSSVTVP